MLKTINNKIKSKNGNSFLFMPYLVTFGVMIMYIIMEMGTAYVRQIELQTLTDTMVRAGIYGGMTGNGAQFYEEGYSIDRYGTQNPHIYVNLDDAMARGLARYIYEINITGLQSLKKSQSETKRGQYWIKKVNLCNPETLGSMYGYVDDRTLPVWNTLDNTSGRGDYYWTPISNLSTGSEIMSTGNFYVAIEGEYKTIISHSVIGKDSIDMKSFASALATAEKRTTSP